VLEGSSEVDGQLVVGEVDVVVDVMDVVEAVVVEVEVDDDDALVVRVLGMVVAGVVFSKLAHSTPTKHRK
jgi:hypothetical protein